MRIASLKTLNWMAYPGEQGIERLPTGPIGVVARWADNVRRSNWAGKTALLEAIDWCFYKRHRKRTEDGLIYHGESICAVELALEGEHTNVVVTRRHPRGGPTALELHIERRGVVPADVDQVETLTGEAAEEELMNLLRLDAEDSLATTNFAQGDVEAMVGERSGERRKVVARWLELELWGRLGAASRVKNRDAVAMHTALVSRPDESLGRSAEEVDADLVAKRAELARVTDWELPATEGNLAAQRSDKEGAVLRREYEAAVAEAKKYREVLITESPRASEMAAAEERIREVDTAVGLAQAEVSAAEALVSDGFNGTCPITCKACPVSDVVSSETAAAASRLERARVALGEAEVSQHVAQQELSVEDDFAEKRQKATTLMNQAMATVRRLKAQVGALPAPTADSQEQIAKLEEEWRDLLSEQAELRADVRALEAEAKEVVARQQRLQKRAEEVRAAARQVRVTALAARALGTSGIVARITADSMGALEKRANALLEPTGLSFTLAWERETKELAPACEECGHGFKGKRDKSCPLCGTERGMKRSDEVEFLVDDGSQEVEDARAKSGGARTLVASAVRLAGGMMLRERRGSTVAWATVDEPFGFLDAANREELARTFTSMMGSVGLEQAFIVSHDMGLLEKLPARICITRDGSSSRYSLEA